MSGQRRRRDPIERFVPKIKLTPGTPAWALWWSCWNWTGAMSNTGYGTFSLNSRTVGAHRAAWILLHGQIGDGLTIDHRCINPRCVNPLHMEVVTQAVNTLRGSSPAAQASTLTECQRGHPFDTHNTYVTPDGRRQCRACGRARQRARIAGGRRTEPCSDPWHDRGQR